MMVLYANRWIPIKAKVTRKEYLLKNGTLHFNLLFLIIREEPAFSTITLHTSEGLQEKNVHVMGHSSVLSQCILI